MWICLNDAFLSVVYKDCLPHELLVRARRKGDIERVFPDARVTRYVFSDYLYRAVILRKDVALALTNQAYSIDYGNFKDSVKDDALHDAYERVWHVIAKLQPLIPYSGWFNHCDAKRRSPSPAASSHGRKPRKA